MNELKFIPWIIATVYMLSLTGCDNNKNTNNPAGPGIAKPTYYDHVAHILNDNCVTCHKEGRIAPFALDSYESAVKWGAAIKQSTANRTMPPWNIDNSGACNTFQNARWLDEDDIATLANWVDKSNFVEGNIENAPQPNIQPGLSRVDRTLDTRVEYTPTGNSEHPDDDYRCFLVDPNISDTEFLTAYEVKPGNSSIVHHIVLFSLQTAEAENQAETLDAQDSLPGYTCFGDSGIANTDQAPFVAAWAPGIRVTKFPAGTGVKLPAGRKMILQVHYNLDAGQGADRTQMDLQLTASVNNEAFLAPIADMDMVLAPGKANASTSTQLSFGVDVLVHGMFPHMHTLGKTLVVNKLSGILNTTKTCMIDVTR